MFRKETTRAELRDIIKSGTKVIQHKKFAAGALVDLDLSELWFIDCRVHDFSYSKMDRTRFTRCNMKGVKARGVRNSAVRIQDSDIRGAVFTGWRAADLNITGSRIDKLEASGCIFRTLAATGNKGDFTLENSSMGYLELLGNEAKSVSLYRVHSERTVYKSRGDTELNVVKAVLGLWDLRDKNWIVIGAGLIAYNSQAQTVMLGNLVLPTWVYKEITEKGLVRSLKNVGNDDDTIHRILSLRSLIKLA